MNDCSSKLLVSEVYRGDAALKGKMKEKKMEKLIKYWNEYLGDCNAVHKYLKEREKKSSNKLVWKFLRFGEVFFRSLGQVSEISKCCETTTVCFISDSVCEQSIPRFVDPPLHLHHGCEGRSRLCSWRTNCDPDRSLSWSSSSVFGGQWSFLIQWFSSGNSSTCSV